MQRVDRVEVQAEREQREFPHLDFGPKQIVGRISRLQDLFRQDFERAIAHFGVTPTEVGILTVLRAQGAPYALAPHAINQRRFSTVSSGGLTNMLHALEKRGLVERTPDPHDRRGVLIRLTRQALAMVDSLIEARVSKEHQWVAALNPRERETLETLLRKLLVSLEPLAASTKPSSSNRSASVRGRSTRPGSQGR